MNWFKANEANVFWKKSRRNAEGYEQYQRAVAWAASQTGLTTPEAFDFLDRLIEAYAVASASKLPQGRWIASQSKMIM